MTKREYQSNLDIGHRRLVLVDRFDRRESIFVMFCQLLTILAILLEHHSTFPPWNSPHPYERADLISKEENRIDHQRPSIDDNQIGIIARGCLILIGSICRRVIIDVTNHAVIFQNNSSIRFERIQLTNIQNAQRKDTANGINIYSRQIRDSTEDKCTCSTSACFRLSYGRDLLQSHRNVIDVSSNVEPI
jgi:hypothetical protein